MVSIQPQKLKTKSRSNRRQIAPIQRQAPPQASDRPIEEIQVLGTRTLYSIRMEIVDEENKIFSMFNELNSDDRFDILCDKIAPTGSHIQQRVCEPRFVTETRAQMTQDYVRGIGMLVESSAVMAETCDRTRRNRKRTSQNSSRVS
ncbi:MAG: hypothetical protein ACJZ8M_09750 [Pseudohongiellaceae bacterium]